MSGENLPIPTANIISAETILTNGSLRKLETNIDGYIISSADEKTELCCMQGARSNIQNQIDTLVKYIQTLKEQMDELARVQTKHQREKLTWLKNKDFLK